jgi:hypothetical protein
VALERGVRVFATVSEIYNGSFGKSRSSGPRN